MSSFFQAPLPLGSRWCCFGRILSLFVAPRYNAWVAWTQNRLSLAKKRSIGRKDEKHHLAKAQARKEQPQMEKRTNDQVISWRALRLERAGESLGLWSYEG